MSVSGDVCALSVVFQQYSLLRNIFQHLPYRDLLSAASVSHLFREVAEVTKQDPSRTNLAPVVLHWQGQRRPNKEYRQHPVFESPNHKDLKEHLECTMSEAYRFPSRAVAFLSGDVNAFIGPEGRLEPVFMVDMKRLKGCFPRECVDISLVCSGVVGENGTGGTYEVENISGSHSPTVSILMFPRGGARDSDCQIVPFSVNENMESLRSFSSPEEKLSFRKTLLEKACRGKLSDASKVKAVIVLSNYHEMPHALFLLQQIGLETGKSVAVGGAIGHFARASYDSTPIEVLAKNMLEDSDDPDEAKGTWTSTGLIFSGDSVSAASVLLPPSVRNEKKVELALSELKRAGLDEAKSCAFMFACCGRGRGFYKGKPCVESRAFKKLFPKTPLIGLFGGGEVGMTFIPGQDDKIDPEMDPVEAKRRKKEQERLLSSDDLMHAYSTVFVLISFK